MTLRNVIEACRLEVTYCSLLQGSLDRRRILRVEDEGSTFLFHDAEHLNTTRIRNPKYYQPINNRCEKIHYTVKENAAF